MRAQTSDVIRETEAEIKEILESGAPSVVLVDLTFDGEVTIEYPETHSLMVRHCNFEDAVTLKALTVAASPAEVTAAAAGLRRIEADLDKMP